MRTLRNLAYFAVGCFLAASFLLGTTYARADHPVRAAIAPSVHQMYEEGASCSAVMIAPGLARTAAHCLKMTSPVVTIDGYDYRVTEGYAASPRDVAVLIIPGAPCPCARVADTALEIGDPVVAAGYPNGIALTVTYGEMQARVVLPQDGQEYLLVTARAMPGHSGGGVFNQYGELVGTIVSGEQGMYTLAVEVIALPLFTDGMKYEYPRKEVME